MADSSAKRGGNEDSDLGLSGRIAQSPQARIMRADGSLNVRRVGIGFWDRLQVYQHLIVISWGRFTGYVLATYFLVNVVFACLYVAAGEGAIAGGETGSLAARFESAFFFSVQTIATIGYGQMTPRGAFANSLVALEALTGLMGFALATGILFARFSRPQARILHSRCVLVAPYRDGKGLMFRIANGSDHQLIDIRATVTFSRMETDSNGKRVRRYVTLDLERNHVSLLPTQWVVVHPIVEGSPLWGMTAEDLGRGEAEVFVIMTAMEETFSQVVHTRFSYAGEEIVYGARFADLFGTGAGGALTVDVSRLGEVERVGWE